MTECNPDLHEITMSDEDLERAMRVYRPTRLWTSFARGTLCRRDANRLPSGSISLFA